MMKSWFFVRSILYFYVCSIMMIINMLHFLRIMETPRRKFAPGGDFISHMPDNVVTNILDRLPLQDAVRTDILSKTWRFKWTMLSQLVFDDNFFECLLKTKAKNTQARVIISRLLLHLRGSITKFVLRVDDELSVEDDDISHWILFLSRKGIKEFILEHYYETPYKLPTHLFSCLDLTHLELDTCCFRPPPTNFHGFPNLLSLDLHSLSEERSNVFWEFITKCPLLESLKLTVDLSSDKIKVAEIAKLENLKILSLYYCHLDTMNNFCTTFELLGSLPKLQELRLDFMGGKLTEGGAKHRFSTAFPSLKALKLSRMCLDVGLELSCAIELIRSCPNLQTLEITTNSQYTSPPQPVDYHTTEQLQLRSVMFEYWKGSENDVCLLKYILACSPFLKKSVIRPYALIMIASDERLKFTSKLMKLHRASPVVDINIS
ncbi:F-box/FBD/LRR-repeat protein At1g13570-like [Bidens hawaiensis]|uniref:F-box/FBD/LRR-repeat protein At1g13570-like n=1 Tax=Bidens hawaiensis TaxID=980011 RepID=UPI004049BAA3